MANPEVSVIIPTYNRRAMLREAIASVLAQRHVSFELIVVDDGSTDGTVGECRKLSVDDGSTDGSAEECRQLSSENGVQDVPFKLIQNGINQGVAAARNAGIEVACAPLIAFLDSDDLWAPSKLRCQLDFMAAHPDCQIAQCKEIWIRKGRPVNPGRRHRKRSGDIFVESLQTCLISPSAVVMRTGLLRSVGGFDQDFLAAEDYDLWLRVLLRHEAGLIERPLVTRRAGHPGQLSATVCAIDRYRILALLKLLANTHVELLKRAAACRVLIEKCTIYALGLRRRGRIDDALFITELARRSGEWQSRPNRCLSEAVLQMRKVLKQNRDADAAAAWDAVV